MHSETQRTIGLCAGCRHARLVSTPRSRFWLCERSREDASFDRYPRLPVLACRGFEQGEPTGGDGPAVDEGPAEKK